MSWFERIFRARGNGSQPAGEQRSAPGSLPPGAPQTRINPIDGAEMVLIPEGDFLMGDDKHTETLEAFYIYKNLVTVGQYGKFCEETGYRMPEAPGFNWNWYLKDHPIVNVCWDDAMEYCRWAGVALPTEAQWEKAARGTDGRRYPWGDDWDPTKCANSAHLDEAGPGTTVAVGRYTDSPYGLSDMAGNVWQWCADDTDGTGKCRVLKGASSFNIDEAGFRAAYRAWTEHGWKDANDGFRCVARAAILS
jgi:serine/threonine-protein kinase